MIYLNNAERTLEKPEGVMAAQPETAQTVKALVAQLFNLNRPQNVYLTSSGQDAVKAALHTFIEKGSHVLSTETEAEDTRALLAGLETEKSCKVTYIGTDAYGRLNYDGMEAALRPETKAIVCAHGSGASGNIADLERICVFARRHGLLVIADGRQTAGGFDVNLENLGVDIYCFTGEKMLMGPEGIGGICLKDGVNPAELSQLEEIPGPEVLGSFAKAVSFILDKGIYGVAMLPHRLEKRFFESAKGMDPVTVYGDYGTNDRLPIVSIKAEGHTPEEIRDYMAERGITIGVTEGFARFSFGYFNTRAQVKETVWALMDFLGIDDLYLLP